MQNLFDKIEFCPAFDKYFIYTSMITILKPFGIKLDNYAVPPVHNIILVGFFFPTIHEKKLSGKAILRKERKASAILHRFYKRVQQIFQLQQLNKTRQKMHFEQKKKADSLTC